MASVFENNPQWTKKEAEKKAVPKSLDEVTSFRELDVYFESLIKAGVDLNLLREFTTRLEKMVMMRNFWHIEGTLKSELLNGKEPLKRKLEALIREELKPEYRIGENVAIFTDEGAFDEGWQFIKMIDGDTAEIFKPDVSQTHKKPLFKNVPARLLVKA